MSLWLYQMNASKWQVERYRAEVWEGTDIQNWRVGQVRALTPLKLPELGEIVVFLYVKTGQDDPGIYGWGIVLRRDELEMNFRLATPSDYLKMNPLWDNDVDILINELRGNMTRATMYEAKLETLNQIRNKIAWHVYGRSS